MSRPQDEIAQLLGVSPSTINFEQIEARDARRQQIEARDARRQQLVRTVIELNVLVALYCALGGKYADVVCIWIMGKDRP